MPTLPRGSRGNASAGLCLQSIRTVSCTLSYLSLAMESRECLYRFYASFAAAKLHHIARRAQPSSSLAEYVSRYSRSASLSFSGNRWPDVAGTTGYEYPSGGYFVDHVEDDYVE